MCETHSPIPTIIIFLEKGESISFLHLLPTLIAQLKTLWLPRHFGTELTAASKGHGDPGDPQTLTDAQGHLMEDLSHNSATQHGRCPNTLSGIVEISILHMASHGCLQPCSDPLVNSSVIKKSNL